LDWPSPIVLAFNSCGSFLIVHAATSPTATQESTGGAVSVMCFAVVEFWLMSLVGVKVSTLTETEMGTQSSQRLK
jgi:hypothetical protein